VLHEQQKTGAPACLPPMTKCRTWWTRVLRAHHYIIIASHRRNHHPKECLRAIINCESDVPKPTLNSTMSSRYGENRKEAHARHWRAAPPTASKRKKIAVLASRRTIILSFLILSQRLIERFIASYNAERGTRFASDTSLVQQRKWRPPLSIQCRHEQRCLLWNGKGLTI
jgi:hypothetical protein